MFQSRNGSAGAGFRDEDSGNVPPAQEGSPRAEEMIRHLKPRYERGSAPAKPGESSAPRARSSNPDGALIIGAGVEVKGTISSCDELIVEGRVESTVECRLLLVAETGTVKGEVVVHELEVRGEFEGMAEVAGCLTVRASGRLSGAARYGEIEIERGGILSGNLSTLAETEEAPRQSSSKSQSTSSEDVSESAAAE